MAVRQIMSKPRTAQEWLSYRQQRNYEFWLAAANRYFKDRGYIKNDKEKK